MIIGRKAEKRILTEVLKKMNPLSLPFMVDAELEKPFSSKNFFKERGNT